MLQQIARSPVPFLQDVLFGITYSNQFTDKDDPALDDAHIHDCYEFYVNLSGDVSFLVNNMLYRIRPGTAVLTKPGDVHHCIFNRSCCHEHYCFWIKPASGSQMDQLLTEYGFPSIFDTDPDISEILFAELPKLKDAMDAGMEFQKTVCLMKILEALLLHKHSEKQVTIEIPQVLQTILDYIDRNFSRITHVSEILPTVYISHATLNRLFRQYIHLTPRSFLEAKKLAYAKQLLQNRELNIADISAMAGFSDCSHFISVFRKKFGQTPYRYRKDHP